MKCPACGFENFDRAVKCVRCQALLMQQTVVDCEVPRAKSRHGIRNWWYGRLRAWGFRWQKDGSVPERWWRKIRLGTITFPGLQDLPVRLVLFDFPLCLFLPSSVQFMLKRKYRAYIFLGMALSGLLAIFILMGTRFYLLGFYLFAMAQTCAFCDLIVINGWNRMRRLVVSLLVSIIVFYTMFYAETRVLDRALRAYELMMIPQYYLDGELIGGMIVRMERPAQYQAGDIVLLRNYWQRGPGYVNRGDYLIIDRLLAKGENTLKIKENRLIFDNGEVNLITPLNPEWHYPDGEIKLSANEYAIIRSWFTGVYGVREVGLRPKVTSGDIECKISKIVFPLWQRKAL